MLYHLFRMLKCWIISAVKLSTPHIFWKSHDWESNIATEKGEGTAMGITSTDYAI